MSDDHQYSSLKDGVGGSGKNSMDSDNTIREDQDLPFQPKKKSAVRRAGSFIFYCVILLIGALVIFKVWDFVVTLEDKLEALELDGGARQPTKCTTPAVRRSWKTLSDGEKMEYIKAVQCLATKPSYINSNSTLYDDFSYMHILQGNMMHFGSGNLPWHRVHLHLYEHALRTECGYNGRQVYWEWEIESDDPVKSNFFDSKIGFGGDGNLTGPYLDAQQSLMQVDPNRCIMDGPFAHFRPQWYGRLPMNREPFIEPIFNPHCITRGYTDAFKKPKENPEDWPPIGFSQAAIAEVMKMEDYSEFNLALEAMHSWLPVSLNGDYMSLSAPNDPTFFPHLTNIDRLWWKWQRQDSKKNLMAYNGSTFRDSGVEGSLDDVLPFPAYPGLERPMTVRDMMDTENDYLCYSY